MHAVARLAFGAALPNIQASWVKMGPESAAALLSSGCNDMGGSIMNESITRAAGVPASRASPPLFAVTIPTLIISFVFHSFLLQWPAAVIHTPTTFCTTSLERNTSAWVQVHGDAGAVWEK